MSKSTVAVPSVTDQKYFWRTLKKYVLTHEATPLEWLKSVATAESEVIDVCINYLVEADKVELVEDDGETVLRTANPETPAFELPAEGDKPKAKGKARKASKKPAGAKGSSGTPKGNRRSSGRKAPALSSYLVTKVLDLKKSDKEALIVILEKSL